MSGLPQVIVGNVDCLNEYTDQRGNTAYPCSQNYIGKEGCGDLCIMLKDLKNLVVLDLRYARHLPLDSPGLDSSFSMSACSAR